MVAIENRGAHLTIRPVVGVFYCLRLRWIHDLHVAQIRRRYSLMQKLVVTALSNQLFGLGTLDLTPELQYLLVIHAAVII